jgi:hypothetical protein
MNLSANMPDSAVESALLQWLDNIVIGLNLCPFAARPVREGRLRIHVSQAGSELELLTELELELRRLDETPAAVLETTVIAVPNMLRDFADYNDFLDRVDALLEHFEWSGEYQVASFHPHYQFADTHPDAAENLSNRSPWPLLHLLREDSVSAALDSHPNPEDIPRDNIRKLRALSPEQRRQLFGYLP